MKKATRYTLANGDFAYIEDRDLNGVPYARGRVLDNEGEEVGHISLPVTGDQVDDIFAMLRRATYNGVEAGKAIRSTEIRQLLGAVGVTQ